MGIFLVSTEVSYYNSRAGISSPPVMRQHHNGRKAMHTAGFIVLTDDGIVPMPGGDIIPALQAG